MWRARLAAVALHLVLLTGAFGVMWSLSCAAPAVWWLAPGLLVMFAATVAGVLRRWLRRDRYTWRSAIMPAIVAATVVAGTTGAPLTWRWAASEAAFDRVRATLPPTGPHRAVGVPAHIGWYGVSSADVYPGGYVFTAAGTDDLTDCGSGFAYLPGGPIDVAGDQFVRIHGAWYRWTCSS